MDSNQRRAIERECQELIIRFGQYSDHGEAQKTADLYTLDAVVGHGAHAVTGRDNILATLKDRSPGKLNRHVAGNFMIDVADEKNASGIAYYISFSHDWGKEPAKPPAPISQPFSMGEWHFKFALTSEGWRISRRETKRLFERPGG